MSFQAITGFLRRVSEDESLKAEVQSALDDRAEAAAFEVVEIGKQNGFEFSATELREYLASDSSEVELSDEQLAAAAGGVRYLRSADLSGFRKIRLMPLNQLRARRLNKGRI